MFADLLHLYAAFAYHLGPVQIGYLATGGAIIALPIGFLAGWILDRFGRKRSMIPGFAGVSLAMAGLAVAGVILGVCLLSFCTGVLAVSSVVDIAIASTLAVAGIAMAPITAAVVGSVLASAVLFALVIDLIKLPVFSHLAIAEATATAHTAGKAKRKSTPKTQIITQ